MPSRPGILLAVIPRNRSLPPAVAVFASGCLAACSMFGGAPAPAAPAPLPVLQSTGNAVVATSLQGGARILLARPQTLQVELASDASAVSASYEWLLTTNDPAVLAPQTPKFVRTSLDVNAFQSAGITLWRFVPLAAGRVAMEFELRRRFSRDAPIATVRYDVVVR